MQAKPFLKWAGGKNQLLKQLEILFPQELKAGVIQRYIEPFIGGGAIFFYIAQHYKIEDFFISDINPELILAYTTIQRDVDNLIENLSQLQTEYLVLNEEERKEYFYKVRETFNAEKSGIDFQNYSSREWMRRTSQLLFLNRTCFNGLFRVNSKGGFNVPPGRYKNPKICDAENLKAVSNLLQKTQIHLGDFTKCESFVNDKSFVYFDPPYRPISKTANFTSYAKEKFDDSEQLRLCNFFNSLDAKGAKLMLSNSDPKNEDEADNFFEIAYQKYNLKRIQATRAINSKASGRGKISEIIIMNY